MVDGRARAQDLYIEAPPPANGKQKSRNRAVGLGAGQVIQSLNFWLIDFGSLADVVDYNFLNVSSNEPTVIEKVRIHLFMACTRRRRHSPIPESR